jgi:hypothetical protein
MGQSKRLGVQNSRLLPQRLQRGLHVEIIGEGLSAQVDGHIGKRVLRHIPRRGPYKQENTAEQADGQKCAEDPGEGAAG